MRLAVLLWKNTGAFWDDDAGLALDWRIFAPDSDDLLDPPPEAYEDDGPHVPPDDPLVPVPEESAEVMRWRHWDWAERWIREVSVSSLVEFVADDPDGLYALVIDVVGVETPSSPNGPAEWDEDIDVVTCKPVAIITGLPQGEWWRPTPSPV